MKYIHIQKKQNRHVIWTAFSRNENRVIAYVIGEGIATAIKLYKKVKKLRKNIEKICTDANSCYEVAFKKIKEKHVITKKETHLIEASNSSIRDNLARFNRRSKRYSKSLEMLKISLDLHFHRFFFFNENLSVLS